MKLRLACQVTDGRNALIVDYVLSSADSNDAGVFNQIPSVQPDGTMEYDQRAYVALEGSVLVLRKCLLPIPEGLQMAARSMPFVSRLAAGTQLKEAIKLPSPVRAMHPYQAAELRLATGGEIVADQPAEAREFRIEIGAFPLDAGCRLVAEHPAHPNALSPVPPGPAAARQEVFAFSQRLPRPIRVLTYRAVPW